MDINNNSLDSGERRRGLRGRRCKNELQQNCAKTPINLSKVETVQKKNKKKQRKKKMEIVKQKRTNQKGMRKGE